MSHRKTEVGSSSDEFDFDGSPSTKYKEKKRRVSIPRPANSFRKVHNTRLDSYRNSGGGSHYPQTRSMQYLDENSSSSGEKAVTDCAPVSNDGMNSETEFRKSQLTHPLTSELLVSTLTSELSPIKLKKKLMKALESPTSRPLAKSLFDLPGRKAFDFPNINDPVASTRPGLPRPTKDQRRGVAESKHLNIHIEAELVNRCGTTSPNDPELWIRNAVWNILSSDNSELPSYSGIRNRSHVAAPHNRTVLVNRIQNGESVLRFGAQVVPIFPSRVDSSWSDSLKDARTSLFCNHRSNEGTPHEMETFVEIEIGVDQLIRHYEFFKSRSISSAECVPENEDVADINEGIEELMRLVELIEVDQPYEEAVNEGKVGVEIQTRMEELMEFVEFIESKEVTSAESYINRIEIFLNEIEEEDAELNMLAELIRTKRDEFFDNSDESITEISLGDDEEEYHLNKGDSQEVNEDKTLHIVVGELISRGVDFFYRTRVTSPSQSDKSNKCLEMMSTEMNQPKLGVNGSIRTEESGDRAPEVMDINVGDQASLNSAVGVLSAEELIGQEDKPIVHDLVPTVGTESESDEDVKYLGFRHIQNDKTIIYKVEVEMKDD